MVELKRNTNSTSWITPHEFISKLGSYLQRSIGLDAAADSSNAKHENFFSLERDAFANPWLCCTKKEFIFCNPPYGLDEDKWIARACDQFLAHGREHTIVLLLPAKTGKKWFHKYTRMSCVETILLAGRMQFLDPITQELGDCAPFASCLLVFSPTAQKGIYCDDWRKW